MVHKSPSHLPGPLLTVLFNLSKSPLSATLWECHVCCPRQVSGECSTWVAAPATLGKLPKCWRQEASSFSCGQDPTPWRRSEQQQVSTTPPPEKLAKDLEGNSSRVPWNLTRPYWGLRSIRTTLSLRSRALFIRQTVNSCEEQSQHQRMCAVRDRREGGTARGSWCKHPTPALQTCYFISLNSREGPRLIFKIFLSSKFLLNYVPRKFTVGPHPQCAVLITVMRQANRTSPVQARGLHSHYSGGEGSPKGLLRVGLQPLLPPQTPTSWVGVHVHIW